MARKYLTEVFPFLLPIRRKQKKLVFYAKKALDENKYSATIREQELPNTVFTTSSLLINENSGSDIIYQHNKVHNLKIAAKKLNGLVIKQGETFSFCKAIKNADKEAPYKDGLNLMYGKIHPSYGGGLCQLSSMLYWLFLNSSLTIVERHGHAKQSFPTTTESLPIGTDATTNEGWLDLVVENETFSNFQIQIDFDDDYMYGKILSDMKCNNEYKIENDKPSYLEKKGKIYQITNVYKTKIHKDTERTDRQLLYKNVTEIGYDLPEDTYVKREVANNG